MTHWIHGYWDLYPENHIVEACSLAVTSINMSPCFNKIRWNRFLKNRISKKLENFEALFWRFTSYRVFSKPRSKLFVCYRKGFDPKRTLLLRTLIGPIVCGFFQNQIF